MNSRYDKMGLLSLWEAWDAIWYKVTEQEAWGMGCYPYSIPIEGYEHEGDTIDGVWFFADCTVEFHLKEARDAYNWTTFPREVIIEILKRVENSSAIMNKK